MKNFAFLVLFCLSTAFAVAQLKLTNNSLVTPDDNILYAGIENQLRVQGQEFTRVLSSANSQITMRPGEFIVVPTAMAGLDTIQVYLDKKLLIAKVYAIEKINDPVALLAFSTDTVMPAGRILVNPYLSVSSPGSKYKNELKVASFECSLKRLNGQSFSFEVNGNKLPDDMLALVKKLNSGDSIHFTTIYVKAPLWQYKKVIAPFSVTIK